MWPKLHILFVVDGKAEFRFPTDYSVACGITSEILRDLADKLDYMMLDEPVAVHWWIRNNDGFIMHKIEHKRR